MPYEDTEILKFNQWRKFDKEPFIVYADLKCITEKIDLCKNNPESSSITKVHLPSGFSVSTISSFWSTENKHDIYRRKSCMKKFCKSLREYAMKIINFKEKLSIKDQQESYGKGKTCYIRKEKVENKYLKNREYRKTRDHCHYTGTCTGAANSICNLKHSGPKKVSVVFHNGSKYDYHFIIKELKEEFTCLKENIGKYIKFAVKTKNITRIVKNGEEIAKTLLYYNLLKVQDLWQAHYQIL